MFKLGATDVAVDMGLEAELDERCLPRLRTPLLVTGATEKPSIESPIGRILEAMAVVAVAIVVAVARPFVTLVPLTDNPAAALGLTLTATA